MPRRIVAAVLVASILSGTAAARAAEDREEVPAALRGTWGEKGWCDLPARRLTITARTAARGEDPPAPVYYAPGERAIFWDQEYETENFAAGSDPDILVDNAEGFGMPSGRAGYARCGPGLARVPWPPR